MAVIIFSFNYNDNVTVQIKTIAIFRKLKYMQMLFNRYLKQDVINAIVQKNKKAGCI